MRGKLLAISKWLWMATVVVVAGKYVAENHAELSGSLSSVPSSQIALSFFLLIVGKVLLVGVSRRSIVGTTWFPTFREMFSVCSLTQLAKYIPGGIWHFVGRIGVYRVNGMPLDQAGRAVLVENVWLVSSAFWIGVLFYLPTSLAGRVPPAGILLLEALLVSLWMIGNAVIDRFHRPEATDRRSWLGGLSGLQVGAWVILGLSYWALFPQAEAGRTFFVAVGVFCLAWVGGYAAVFAPGGLGVRELALGFLLSGFIPSSQAVFLAVVHRVVWITVEILLGALAAFGTDLEAYRGRATPGTAEPLKE